MNITELKTEVINRINALNEEDFLVQLKDIIDWHNDTEPYKLSDEERIAVEDGIKDIEEGRYISDEDLRKNISGWLKK
ncbi:MAG: hypothetical protein J0M18_21700 [Ignavibacteria bacterium]|nr:hypothetical protein [Ignavibacteria bacterium]